MRAGREMSRGLLGWMEQEMVYDIYDYSRTVLRKAESRSKQQPSRVDRA
jgi:hypothetical protein